MLQNHAINQGCNGVRLTLFANFLKSILKFNVPRLNFKNSTFQRIHPSICIFRASCGFILCASLDSDPCENFHLFKEDETMIALSEESLGASAAELEHD